MATILTKGQSYTDPMGNTGTVGFDSATGKPLAEGQTTTIPDTTITADNLAPMTPINLPEPVPDTTSQEIINGATAGAEVKAETDRLNAEKDKGIADVTKLLGDIGAVEGKQFTYEEQAGASSAKKLADDLQSSIDIESRALKNYTDNLYKNPNLTTTLVNRLATEQERKSASTIADLSIAQQVATRNYDRAVALAEKKVEAELAPIKRDLEAKKFVFDANIDLWNAGEKSILQSALQKQEREYQAEKDTRTQIENLKIEARKNGAPDSVINAMAQAKTLDEALASTGSYLISQKEKLEIQKLQGDIEKNTLELIQARNEIGGTTGSAVGDIIAASSKYGDKRLTDSQLEKIQKAQQALGSMEALQGLLSQGKDGLKTTGAITGRTRTLVSQLGGDADAKAINATIQGLIPTVARGIFGEVGVLTDQDIANYRKTVPNLTSSEAQNELVSIIMYDVLSRSLENTLVTNAQNQTNVSGFLPTYNDTLKRIDTLKSSLGVSDNTPISPVNQVKMDNAWSSLSTTNISNSLDSLLNQ